MTFDSPDNLLVKIVFSFVLFLSLRSHSVCTFNVGRTAENLEGLQESFSCSIPFSQYTVTAREMISEVHVDFTNLDKGQVPLK